MRHLIFGSATSAQKAKKVLERGGMTVSIVKTPEKYSRHSCSYSIRTTDSDFALMLLKKAGITVKGKY
ncbi:MAG: DUF3343 domain-containing protein [Oscillospiraceae bacterium]|nr:DUF3343 domain-containing protein [Oscillospiraceae bacterium]